MEFRIWQCFIAINCAIIIPCIVGKTISLNDIIAAESRTNPKLNRTLESNIKDITTEYLTTKEVSTSTPLIKSKRVKTKLIHSDKKTFPSKNKKAFHFKSPLKPTSLRQKLRNRLKTPSIKREIGNNENTRRKYTPLLRNLGVLFDNILSKDKSRSIEVIKRKPKPIKRYTDRNDMVCECKRKTNPKIANIKSQKKTVTISKTITTEVPNDAETTTETTINSALGNISSVGQNTDIPILLSRNTTSSWGDNNGYSERSSPTFHGSIERNITRYNGDSEHNTRIRQNGSNTESNEEDTFGTPRNYASSYGFGRGNGNNTRRASTERSPTNETKNVPEDEDTTSRDDIQRQVEHEVGRNETESRHTLSESYRGLRRLLSEDKIGTYTESIQSKENYEESDKRFAINNTSHKRIPDGSGPFTSEDKNVSTEDETIISIKDLSNLTLALQSPPKGKVPVVTIFGGYSVARDINGPNKLSEQSIHIHS